MQRYTVLIMTDQTSPVRRFSVRREVLKRSVAGLVIFAVLLVAGGVDYFYKMQENSELDALRLESLSQREQIYGLEASLNETEERLDRLGQLERKLRVITNLPGGDESGLGGMGGGLDEGMPPLDEPLIDPTPVSEQLGDQAGAKPIPERQLVASVNAARMAQLRKESEKLEVKAAAREVAFAQLADHLQGQSKRYGATPSVWPIKGWLTSRFGPRISPFTGKRQFHSGIDIGAGSGSPVIAPAAGKVTYAGQKRLLGYTLVIDHGYGLRTTYGHNSSLHVKKGDRVERGDLLASVGNTGRSTGPHLHYAIAVDGRAVNPLDYILD